MKRKNLMFQFGPLALVLLIFVGYLIVRQIRADDAGPQIMIAEEIPELSVNDPLQSYLQGVTATDKRDGDVTEQLLVENIYGVTQDHQVTVTYAAFDRAGNVTKAQRQIRFTDYHSPRFTLNCALAFPAASGLDVMDYIGAQDIFDGNIVRRVRATLISNSGTLSDVGVHDVKLQVTNSLGDTAELVLPVEVYAPEKYSATLALDSYLVYLPVGSSFHAQSYLRSMTCGGTTYSLDDDPDEVSVSVSGTVDTQVPGLYPVAYTVRYEDTDVTYTAYSKLFVVVEG